MKYNVTFDCSVSYEYELGKANSLVIDYYYKSRPLINTNEDLIVSNVDGVNTLVSTETFKYVRLLSEPTHINNDDTSFVVLTPNKKRTIRYFSQLLVSNNSYTASVRVKNNSNINYYSDELIFIRFISYRNNIYSKDIFINNKDELHSKVNVGFSTRATISRHTKDIDIPNKLVNVSDTYKMESKYTTEVPVRGTSGIIVHHPCYEKFTDNIKQLIIPVKVGKYTTILEFPDDITIEYIYRLPYGLKYDSNKIYGRILFNTQHTLKVFLSDNTVIKVTLKPVITDKFIF